MRSCMTHQTVRALPALHARASTDPWAVTAVARVRPSASRLLRGVAGTGRALGRATGCGPAGHGVTTGPGPDHAALSPPAGQWPSGPRRPPAPSRSDGP